jgi:hypothetical protein
MDVPDRCAAGSWRSTTFAGYGLQCLILEQTGSGVEKAVIRREDKSVAGFQGDSAQEIDRMHDLMIGLIFALILVSPAIIAGFSGKSSEMND